MSPKKQLPLPLLAFGFLILSGPLWANSQPARILIDADHLPDGMSTHARVDIPVDPGRGLALSGKQWTLPLPPELNSQQGRLDLAIQFQEDAPLGPDHPFLVFGQEDQPPTLTLFKARRHWTFLYEAEEGQKTELVVRTRGLSPEDWLYFSLGWNDSGEQPLLWVSLNGQVMDTVSGRRFQFPFNQLHMGGPEWQATLVQISLHNEAPIPHTLVSGSRTLVVNGANTTGSLHPLWKVANFASRGPRTFSDESDLRVLREKSPFATEVVVDYILGGREEDGEEYYFGQGPDGKPIVDFTKLLRRVRLPLEAGYRPWIGLENVPPLMSDPVQWNTYGNSRPPAEMDLFETYTRMALEALVNEFGREEAARWNYFVATEPDLNPSHWSASKESFLTLLDHTQRALLEVLPEATVSPGNILNPAYVQYSPGPAESEELQIVRSRHHWGLDIIDHMAAGHLHPDGGPGSKMDYFSASWYAGIGNRLDSFDRAVSIMRDRLAKYPQYKDIPIDMREFAVLHDHRGQRLYAGDASEWSASFYAAIARKAYDLNVRYLFEWDHATFGVLHPRGRAIEMLNQMVGGDSLSVVAQGVNSDAECGAIATRLGDEIIILVFNHHHLRGAVVPESIHLKISDPSFVEGHPYRLNEWTLDKDKGTWIHAFVADAQAAGIDFLPQAGLLEASPFRLFGDDGVALFKANSEKYHDLSKPAQTIDNALIHLDNGLINLRIEMPSHSVRLLKITPSDIVN